MSITKDKTAKLIKKYGKNEKDAGSSAAQISILTERINNIPLYSTEPIGTKPGDNLNSTSLPFIFAANKPLVFLLVILTLRASNNTSPCLSSKDKSVFIPL